MSLSVPFMLPAAAGLALLILLGTRRLPRWGPTGRWVALALVGQAAALRLIHAGPTIRYEHMALPGTWSGQEQVAGLLLGLQGLAVLFGLAGARPAWRSNGLAPWRIGLGLTVFFVSSSALSPSPVGYAAEVVFRSLIQMVALGNALLIALALPTPPSRFRWPAWWPAGLGALTSLLAAVLALWVYQRHPHVPDEVAYLIQAGYFAAGKLSLVAPPVPGAFNVDLFLYEPTGVYSAMPPGWPFVLALGSGIGLAWLVNPILAGVNILLCHRLLRECYDAPTAALGTVLLALSPWHLFLGMSFMSHTVTLGLALGAAYLLVRSVKDERPGRLVGSGLLIGLVSIIRPLDGLVLAGILGMIALLARGTIVQRVVRTAVLAAATLVASLAVLPYNAALTGRAGTFPVMLYFDRYYGPGSNALGFGSNRGVGWTGIDPFPGHGAADVGVNALINMFQVNTELLGWATGSLAPILVLVLWPRRWSGADRGMLLGVAVVVVLHAFYWFSGGPDFGARYWFLLVVPAIALAARGLRTLDLAAGPAAEEGLGRASRTGVVLSLLTLIAFVPWRAMDKYWHFRGMQRGVPELAAERQFGRSLVLIQGQRHPDYHGAAVYNPVDLRGANAPIYAWDRNLAIRGALLAAYPDRQVWVIVGPTITGAGYRLLAGPLTPEAAAELPPPPDYPTPAGPNP